MHTIRDRTVRRAIASTCVEMPRRATLAGGASMADVIADVDTTVKAADGSEYYVQVAAEQVGAVWEGCLEFVPLDDSLDVLLTRTETTQPTRDDVVRWSTTLTPVFLQGAFKRAVRETSGRRHIVRDFARIAEDVLVPFDPFE